ncbi:hypothetical protein KKB43_04065 [Patescibacteria group bacterium]|nr:hypothetical protein [Patescibacteria group bacterium]MBU4580165.1 hypothetical protein [Patescibacteria group bacterium]
MIDFLNNENVFMPVILISTGLSLLIGVYAFTVVMITKYYFKKDKTFFRICYENINSLLKVYILAEWIFFLGAFLGIFFMYYSINKLAGDNFTLILLLYFLIFIFGIILGACTRLDGLEYIGFRAHYTTGGPSLRLVWKKEQSTDKFIYHGFLLSSIIFFVLGIILYLFF